MKRMIHDNLKIKILIITFVFSSYVNAQQASLSRELLTFPVSPEAARLGNYGNLPVNLFYGQLEKNIELFNGTVGDYAFPLNLSYNYAGNRVEEAPSIVGLGWQLTVGGVVNKEVRGLPDEHPNGYYRNSLVYQILQQYFTNQNISDENCLKFARGEYDSEVDLYRLSVNGINFSFKIGLDGNPVFLSKHDYKLSIERDLNDNLKILSFTLTDTKSNKYIFQDRETLERVCCNDDIFSDVFPNYTSSWQLTKIITNNFSEINFNYINDDFFNYSFYASGSYRSYFTISNQGNLDMLTDYNQGSTSDLIKRKLLQSVSSDSFTISFATSTLNNQKVYNNITVKDFKNNIVNSFDLSYFDQKNQLLEIKRNTDSYYKFGYYGTVNAGFINSTTSFPWNQDKWGFANGQNNVYGVNIPLSTYTANKNPSFDHTVAGALRQITYPTGGHTLISYEQNKIPLLNLENHDGSLNTRINLKFKSDNTLEAQEVKEEYFTKTFDYPTLASLSHTIQNTDQGFIEMSIIGTQCDSPFILPYYSRVISLRTETGSLTPMLCPRLYAKLDDGCTSSSCYEENNSSGNFIIAPGTYTFRFKTEQNRFKDVRASITLDFYDQNVNDSQNQEPIGGIRVKSISDYPTTEEPVTRFYDYNNSGTQFNIATDKLKFKEIYNIEPSALPPPSFSSIPNNETLTEINSKSNNLIMNRGVAVYYTRITEYQLREEIFTSRPFLCTNCGGDFAGNYDGSQVYTYLNGTFGTTKIKYPQGHKTIIYDNPRYLDRDYPYLPQINDLSPGRLNNSSIYDKTDNFYVDKLKTSEDIYYNHTNLSNVSENELYNNFNYPKSLKVGYKVKRGGYWSDIPIFNGYTVNDYFHLRIYKEIDSESFMYKKTKKDYFNDQIIESQTLYDYNNHNQISKVTTQESNNNVITNELFYPYDFTDNTSLEMVAKNYISPIVKVVNKKNGNIIDSYKYDFTTIGSNLFKPSIFWKSKANGALEKLSAYGYDSKGNVNFIQNIESETLVPPHTITNGPTTMVIWGYNNLQPIAKIENTAGVTISQTLIDEAKAKSNNGTEAELITALNALRASLPNAMVTTYTHIPLVGVSTITDPKGDTITYIYDSFNRLQEVKDKNGNKLSENEYYYRPQN